MRSLVLIAVALLTGCGDGESCKEGESRCDGLVATNCFEGYPGETAWSYDDCETAGYCVLSETGGALCALAPTPDPACTGAVTSHLVCEDGVQIECEGGYRVAEQDCGAPDLCRLDIGVGVCLLLPDPDPLCEDASFDSACDGALNISCFDGWRVEAHDCGAPELCHEFDTGGTACITSVDPDPRCEGITDNLDPAANYCEGDNHLICNVETGLMIIQECGPDEVCGETEAYGRNTCYDPETGY